MLVGEIAHAALVPRRAVPPFRGLVIVSPLGVENTHVVSFLICEWHLIGQLQLLRVLSQWTAIHEECDLLGEYERVSLTLDPELLLHVSKEVAEINVQKVSFLEVNHDVIRVTISQAKDVACHTVASRGPDESVPCLLQLFLPIFGIVFFEMLSHENLDGVIRERVEYRVLELNCR